MRPILIHISDTESEMPFETESEWKNILLTSHVTNLRCGTFHIVSTYNMTYDTELVCRLFLGETKPFYWFYIDRVTLHTPVISLLVLQIMLSKPSAAKVPLDMVDRVLKRALILSLESKCLTHLVPVTCALIARAAAKESA